jgi:hypothetical protein
VCALIIRVNFFTCLNCCIVVLYLFFFKMTGLCVDAASFGYIVFVVSDYVVC